MTTFERAFSDMEKAADSTLNAVKGMEKLAKALQKGAKEGNINAIKKACSNLKDALGSLSQTVTNAVETWPFNDDKEEAYLREHYPNELRDAASEKGLNIYDGDENGKLISYPSIVYVSSGDRTVKIDRKKVATLRPSHLTGILKEKQKKPPRFKSHAFLEALYKAYRLILRGQTSTLSSNDGTGPVKSLVEIYEVLTLLPDIGREYDRTEFAKGIYLLDIDKTLRTKKGVQVSFPSSTGTKRVKDTFHFVGPDGQRVTYYGIQFSGGA